MSTAMMTTAWRCPHETSWVVRGPLVALAIPSVVIGALCVKSVLFGGYFGHSIFVLPANDVMAKVGEELHDPVWLNFALKGFLAPAFWLALSGVIAAWVFFLKKPEWADAAGRALAPLRTLLVNKFYFDWFNENVVCMLARGLGKGLWRGGGSDSYRWRHGERHRPFSGLVRWAAAAPAERLSVHLRVLDHDRTCPVAGLVPGPLRLRAVFTCMVLVFCRF